MASWAGFPSAALAPMPISRNVPPIPTSRAPRAVSKSMGGGAARLEGAATRRARQRSRCMRGPAGAGSCPRPGSVSRKRPSKLGPQHRRAGGLPTLQVTMGAGDFLQRIALVDLDLELAPGDQSEQLLGSGEEIFSLGDVRAQGRAGDEERARRREALEVEGRHRAAGGAAE